MFPDELKKMDQNYTEKELSDVRGILRNARELVKRTVEREKRRICNAKQYLKQELGGVVNRVVFVDANGSGNTQKYLKELVKDFFEQPIVTFFIVWVVFQMSKQMEIFFINIVMNSLKLRILLKR